jgi:hypothetical protein
MPSRKNSTAFDKVVISFGFVFQSSAFPALQVIFTSKLPIPPNSPYALVAR